MFRKAYRLPFSLLGIPIFIDVTFLFILPLFAWMIANQVGYWAVQVGVEDHPSLHRPWVPLVLGLIGALGLFVSILVHELGHSVTARLYGVKVRRITLWLLGGMAQFDEMPRQRGAEAVVAIVGPLVSIAVGVACWGALAVLPAEAVSARFVLSYLRSANIILAIFNMIPALPLDGGRVLRSLLALRLPHLRATQVAANIGKFLAIALGLLGLWSGNLMLVAVAFFVYVAGNAEVRDGLVAEMLAGVTVGDLMTRQIRTVPPDMTLDELARTMVREHQQGFVVVDPATGRVSGMVSLDDLQHPARMRGQASGQGQASGAAPPVGEARVAHVMQTPVCAVPQGAPALEALHRMSRSQCARLAVVDGGGNMVGVVTRNDVLRAIEMRTMGLHWGPPASGPDAGGPDGAGYRAEPGWAVQANGDERRGATAV
jgi:Zn-dependent protease/predicted transcriptional regulator